MEIPVYLFTGFLESGKTKFIQDTLGDKRFNSGERTLLLLCEEGEEEYDPSGFSAPNVWIEILDSESELNAKNLQSLLKKHNAERVVVEYNGMWMLDNLYNALPKGWTVYQEFLFVDSTTFLNYNDNMRALVVDKLKSCEMVVFNRFTENLDQMQFHKIVRAINTQADIALESPDGKVRYDDIEDPLPFDIDAPVIEIGENDYAVWYRDLNIHEDRYEGKTVCFKAMIIKGKRVPAGYVLAGRYIMTCCVDDIAFGGFPCVWSEPVPDGKHWMTVTAKLTFEENEMFGGRGPVLHASALTPAQKPKNEVATFY